MRPARPRLTTRIQSSWASCPWEAWGRQHRSNIETMSFVFDLQSFFAHQIQQGEKEAGKMFEPAVGVVTDNKDPSKLGRVKLKIPILSDNDSTFWAPVVMMGAGKNRGWFFIPEVNDEVLVMFEHGDVNRPVVVS